MFDAHPNDDEMALTAFIFADAGAGMSHFRSHVLNTTHQNHSAQ